MRIPTIQGIIDRRILVNFRVDPNVLSNVCPAPFRPQVVNGFGVAGICLIRLKHIRPKFIPSVFGISSENAAHRIAVEWDVDGSLQTGVYIPRRDTSSKLNAFAGGRLFPGVHNLARFETDEADDTYRIAMGSLDGSTHVAVEGKVASKLPADSIFSSLDDCSMFFEAGAIGYSPTKSTGEFDGLELQTKNWHVSPSDVTHIRSSFFDDGNVFPVGSVSFDNALLMRDIKHEWHGCESICCS